LADRRTLTQDAFVLAPLTRRERFRMVGEGKKVQRGTVAREVAGIRGRMRPAASEYGQRKDESVPGYRAVHMEVAEQNLFARRRAALQCLHECGGTRRLRHGTRRIDASARE